ncbi:MAG: hypothetical protein V9G19_23530 [Tetrasphaera sp.]
MELTAGQHAEGAGRAEAGDIPHAKDDERGVGERGEQHDERDLTTNGWIFSWSFRQRAGRAEPEDDDAGNDGQGDRDRIPDRVADQRTADACGCLITPVGRELLWITQRAAVAVPVPAKTRQGLRRAARTLN